MPTQTRLRSAARHYRLSALLAQRAATEARKARPRGFPAVAGVVLTHQVAQATMSQTAIAAMLAEQKIDAAAEALLNTISFTTATDNLLAMIEAAGEVGFDRLVESLVQDAGRSAESVAITARPHVQHVRYLSPPSCPRCAVLAGRIYRYSEGFQRHPNCDCTMIPVTVASPDFLHDPVELMKQGLITTGRRNKAGVLVQRQALSEADRKAILDGADFNKIVNVRLSKAGLKQSGRVLTRRDRPTPEGIYASTNTREEAVAALKAAGYLL